MTTTADRPTDAAQTTPSYTVIGTRPIRPDGLEKVTGRAKYGADISMPGLLHGKILRSPYAHARIKRIDVSKALALPGVLAAVTGRDFPINAQAPDFSETLGNNRVLAENLLAYDKVLYKGHAVAAVAATNPHVAEAALALIEVEYEPLPVVLNVLDAMKPDAPLLHETLTTRSLASRFGKGTDTGVKSNIASHLQFKRGNLDEGFAKADVIVEREYTTSTVHQGYIEPHTGTASWAANGKLTIWTSTQGPWSVRSQTAALLGIPESAVRVIPLEIGGGFGGKLNTWVDPVAALLARQSGRPVKITMSRQDVFEASGPASGVYIRMKIGAEKAGRITAVHAYMAYEAGAFPGSPVGAGASTGLAPYNIPDLLIDAFDVVVNKPKAASYRAPGSPQAAFAVESAIDELAQKLGMDPLELRLLNAPQQGDRAPNDVPFPRIGCIELEEAMKQSAHYNTPLEGPYRGRGVSVGYWGNATNQSSATINVNGDGTISLITGSVDIGGSRASIAMQAAEVLGLRAEDVAPTVADTDAVGWTGNTGGSRTTFATGIAAINAAEDVKRQMVARAALIWECDAEDVEFDRGVLTSKKNPEVKFTFKELAGKLAGTGGLITTSAYARPAQVGPSYAGVIVDVEVDPDTGKVTILRCTIAQDVGKAMHPSYVEGQMQGAMAQGAGWALNEGYVYREDGTLLNSSYLDYRMPTALDLPMIDTLVVEVANPGHPFGVRGVGEACIVPPAAAVANAVSRATGVRLAGLPMSPGAIMDAIEAAGTK